MKRDENPPLATMSWPDPIYIRRVIDVLRELGDYKGGGRLSSIFKLKTVESSAGKLFIFS